MPELLSQSAQANSYMARIHLVTMPETEQTGQSMPRHRLIEVDGLPLPHIQAVINKPIVDPVTGAHYESPLQHRDLFAIDYPYLSGRPTRDSLSDKKAEIYDLALEEDELEIVAAILGNNVDAIKRSAHFVYDHDTAGTPLLASANKLTRQTNPVALTDWAGARLLAYTVGEAKKYKTAAFRAVIARANQMGIIPKLPEPAETSKADLSIIAVSSLLVANRVLPEHPNYLLSSYTPDGTYCPLASPKLTSAERSFLKRKQLVPSGDEALSREAREALIRRDVRKAYSKGISWQRPERVEAEIEFERLEAQAATSMPLQRQPESAEALADQTYALLDQF